MKKIVSVLLCLCILAVLAALGTTSTYAYDEYGLSELSKCNTVFCSSNETGGYFYGKSNDTVYCARVLPKVTFRYFSVSDAIKSVSQSKNLTCVLSCLSSVTNRYSVSIMDCDSDSVVSYTFRCSDMRSDSFSVTDDSVYVIKTDDLYAYVQCINLESGDCSDLKFDDNVNEVFNNNGSSYARLFNGSIYRLSCDQAYYCADAGEYTDIYNAGTDLIFTDERCLLSLTDGSGEFYIGAQRGHIAESDGCVYYFDGIRVYKVSENEETVIETDGIPLGLVSYGGDCALLTKSYGGRIYYGDEFASETEPESTQASKAEPSEAKSTSENKKSSTAAATNKSSEIAATQKASFAAQTESDDYTAATEPTESTQYIYSDGIIKNITTADTVKNFKTITTASAVYKSSGIEVTSGKLKTGYQTVIDSQRWLLAVRGDVTGEGNVNSRDIALVMKYLCATAEIEGVYAVAADFNLDNTIDCRDAVLIARQWKSG